MTARNAGLLTSGESDSVRLVGPIAPATNRGRSGVRAVQAPRRLAREPRRRHVQLVDERLEAVVGLRDGGAVERARLDDVGAGLEVRVVDAADDVGPRQHEQVVVALQVARVGGEPLAAEVGLGEAVALHHRAHRAVEDEDAVAEDGVEDVGRRCCAAMAGVLPFVAPARARAGPRAALDAAGNRDGERAAGLARAEL